MRYVFLIIGLALLGFNDLVAQQTNPYPHKGQTKISSVANQLFADVAQKPHYIPDNNPNTWDEDPTNYPLEKPHTYINSNQKEVQSPTQYNAIPPNACAVCRDGSYSFSRHRRGTCSRHGGVYKWLKKLPN